uniref:Uncharacterized protein n=1 Tax=Rhizophora mucronata TaxID=61149 RepID=A0A2P2QPG3_RHIMU
MWLGCTHAANCINHLLLKLAPLKF